MGLGARRAAGQHRRIYSFEFYPELMQPMFQDVRIFATLSLVVMLSFQIVFFVNLFWSWKNGPKSGPNPWKANTLEWVAPSPPGHGNFDLKNMPVVYRGPYEYSVPGRDEDYWPQNVPA